MWEFGGADERFGGGGFWTGGYGNGVDMSCIVLSTSHMRVPLSLWDDLSFILCLVSYV